jgi:hypothetical protein
MHSRAAVPPPAPRAGDDRQGGRRLAGGVCRGWLGVTSADRTAYPRFAARQRRAAAAGAGQLAAGAAAMQVLMAETTAADAGVDQARITLAAGRLLPGASCDRDDHTKGRVRPAPGQAMFWPVLVPVTSAPKTLPVSVITASGPGIVLLLIDCDSLVSSGEPPEMLPASWPGPASGGVRGRAGAAVNPT